ncbi:MAG: leucine-rich repeat domain-containing protein [Dehalococcoidales bacterium]|nr:leucine-rich repeat domain-containing protein [Dehalococcoidales bacterium]
MKLILCLVLAMILALVATACGAPAAEPTAEPTAEPPVSATTGPTTKPVSSPDVVIFNDAALEAKVRVIMNQPAGDITLAEAEAMKSLDLANKFQNDMPDDIIIKDISALKYFANLAELNLGFNAVTDLSPLSQLPKLESLHLFSNNSVSDLSPLAALTNLSFLNLQYNRIQDVSPLAGLQNLTALFLKGNAITDYSPLKDIFPNLREKDFEIISIEGVSDEPIIFADPNLESTVRRTLGIQDRPITQKDAYQVQSLDLHHEIPSDEAFSDLTGLEYFVNLELLSLNGNDISDLSPIGGLAKMKLLVISFNEIADLSPLSGMPQLEVLDATSNQISDVSPLAGLTKIWELQMISNQITDISPLASLKNLRALLLRENLVTDYSPLKNIYPQLESKDFKLE